MFFFLTRVSLFAFILHFYELFGYFGCCLDVSITAFNCLERPVNKITCFVSSGALKLYSYDEFH